MAQVLSEVNFGPSCVHYFGDYSVWSSAERLGVLVSVGEPSFLLPEWRSRKYSSFQGQDLSSRCVVAAHTVLKSHDLEQTLEVSEKLLI